MLQTNHLKLFILGDKKSTGESSRRKNRVMKFVAWSTIA